ncbi:MAG: hypothetical protein MRJ92_13115 [Nitrospira sp.]|nr:hypothetical protein [Nitrospira sp.]
MIAGLFTRFTAASFIVIMLGDRDVHLPRGLLHGGSDSSKVRKHDSASS